MKRTVIGAGILLALLLLGLLGSWWMETLRSPVETALEGASEAAFRQDWDRAEELALQAEAAWLQARQGAGILADHGPMEEIDGLFAELKVFGAHREAVHFSAVCLRLCRQLEAMADAHRLSWRNLF